jgi:hypothetical protein
MAVLGSVGVAVYRSAMAGVTPLGLPADAVEAARSTLGGAVAVARDLPAGAGGVLVSRARRVRRRLPGLRRHRHRPDAGGGGRPGRRPPRGGRRRRRPNQPAHRHGRVTS